MKQSVASCERSAKWDNVKFMLIVLVVIGHFLSGWAGSSPTANKIFLWIYTFHMPLFLFVAGLFSKSSINRGRLRGEKVFLYLFLYVILAAFTYLLKLFYGRKAEPEFLGTYHVQWYMFVMAAFLVLMYGLRHRSMGMVLFFGIVLSCFAGYETAIGNGLCLSKMISFFPFFAAGYYIDPQKLQARLQRRAVKGIAVAILVGFTLFIWFQTSWYERHFQPLLVLSTPGVYRKLPWPEAGALYRLVWYALVSLVSLALLALVPSRKLPVSKIGQRTPSIYFWHVPLQMIFTQSGLAAFLQKSVPVPHTLLLLGISVALTFFLSLPIFSKPFTWLMSRPQREIPGEKSAG